MSAPRLHELEISDQLVQLINQNLSGQLGLKVVTVDSLDLFPALENIEDNVPAVFVKPYPTTTLERITTGQTYRITYNFRIVYVTNYGPNEEIERTKILNTVKIGELLIDNVNLGYLSLQNGQVLKATMTSIEWGPSENQYFRDNHKAMVATAFTVIVETTSRL